MNRSGHRVKTDDLEFSAAQHRDGFLGCVALRRGLRGFFFRGEILIFLPARPENESGVADDDCGGYAESQPHVAQSARRFLFGLLQHSSDSPSVSLETFFT